MEAKTPDDIQLSIDLMPEARKHVHFLAAVGQYPRLYAGPILQNAIRRYEQCWLHLAAECGGQKDIAPPGDVHWVWHVHLLAPQFYHTDCTKIVGKSVDHRLRTGNELQDAMDACETLWVEKFPGEPFTVDLENIDEKVANMALAYTSLSEYSLSEAVTRQWEFYYNVSLPHFLDEKFLRNSIKRYKRFLWLKKLNPTDFLVPCYDIDLIWHTHQLTPLLYQQDCDTVLECLLPHDDNVSDRRPGSKLAVSDARTQDLWKETYNEIYKIPGAMYRGKTPFGKLAYLSPEMIFPSFFKRCDLSISQVCVENVEDMLKCKLLISSVDRHACDSYPLLNLPRPSASDGDWNPKPKTVHVDTELTNRLEFELYEEQGYMYYMCMGNRIVRGNRYFALSDLINTCPKEGTQYTDTFELVHDDTGEETPYCVTISLGVGPCEKGNCELTLQIGQFTESVLPNNLPNTWGPIPLPFVLHDEQKKCSIATHSLMNRDCVHLFSARIIHSLPLRMSVVQIFYGNKLCAVSHTIGPVTLPGQNQVEAGCGPSLDAHSGERAMLVKDHMGDWAICVGCWIRPQQSASDPAKYGQLKVDIHNLRMGLSSTLHISNMDDEGVLHIDDDTELLSINLSSGLLTISKETDEVGQHVGLAFTLGVLYALCKPRSVDETGTTILPKFQEDADNNLEQSLDTSPLMLASGYISASPCNSWIHSQNPDYFADQGLYSEWESIRLEPNAASILLESDQEPTGTLVIDMEKELTNEESLQTAYGANVDSVKLELQEEEEEEA